MSGRAIYNLIYGEIQYQVEDDLTPCAIDGLAEAIVEQLRRNKGALKEWLEILDCFTSDIEGGA